MHTKIKKALCKHLRKDKKYHTCDANSDRDFDNSTWRDGLDSTGEFNMCKKCKLNSLLEKYTYPSPNKAICLLKSNSSNKTQTNVTNKNSDSSDKTKINIANKNWLNSDLKEKTKLHSANKNKSKKSCPNMKITT